MKVYFPIHIDGGNRGCEGIAKGTAKTWNSNGKDNLLRELLYNDCDEHF